MSSMLTETPKAETPGEHAVPRVTPLQQTPQRAGILRKLRAKPSAKRSLMALGLLIFCVIVAPFFAPQNPYDLLALDLLDGRLPPGSTNFDETITYWLGTDAQGRDMLSAILYGLRISLFVGLGAVLISVAIGVTLGLLAAYRGGWIDTIVMRAVDFILGFPTMLVALVLLAVLGRGIDKVIIALVVQWAHYARIMRGRALQERRKEYIEAAQNLGFPAWRVMLVHLMPNCIGPVMVFATIQIATAITLEATLSFLGVGVPVTEPSLGLLIASGFEYLLSGDYWISIFPGIALLLLILSINIAGDRLRESLDPRR